MKPSFIFIFFTFLYLFSCSSSNQQLETADNQMISGSYQFWYATAPGESDFSEKGIDIRLEFYPDTLLYKPLHVNFNGRKSFPVTTKKAGESENHLMIDARILLESGLLSEISEHVSLPDRLVYLTENDSTDYIEIHDLERLPDRYD